MNINWVLADSVILDPTQDIDALKNIGALWGSWCTWRAYQTDNVICHSQAKATELVKREFQKHCNFYIPNSVYSGIGCPSGVRLYEGDFVHDVVRQEEIVAIHLAASTSDIVLLLGFDLTKFSPNSDRLKANQAQHHRNHIRQAILDYQQVQWVVIDHPMELSKDLTELSNLTTDSLDNVIGMFSTE